MSEAISLEVLKQRINTAADVYNNDNTLFLPAYECPDRLYKRTSVSPDVRTAWYSRNMLKCKGVLYIQPRKWFLWGGSGVKSLSVVLWMKISTAVLWSSEIYTKIQHSSKLLFLKWHTSCAQWDIHIATSIWMIMMFSILPSYLTISFF